MLLGTSRTWCHNNRLGTSGLQSPVLFQGVSMTTQMGLSKVPRAQLQFRELNPSYSWVSAFQASQLKASANLTAL